MSVRNIIKIGIIQHVNFSSEVTDRYGDVIIEEEAKKCCLFCGKEGKKCCNECRKEHVNSVTENPYLVLNNRRCAHRQADRKRGFETGTITISDMIRKICGSETKSDLFNWVIMEKKLKCSECGHDVDFMDISFDRICNFFPHDDRNCRCVHKTCNLKMNRQKTFDDMVKAYSKYLKANPDVFVEVITRK